MKLSNIITQVLFLAFSVTIDAAPIDVTKGIDVRTSSDGATLAKRACVSTDDVETWLIENSSVGDNTVFYTSGASTQAVADFAGIVGGNWYGSAYGNQEAVWAAECTEGDDLPARLSEALARRATGPTYVMLGEYPIGGDSYWVRFEYPTLNSRGVTITAVNARNTDQRQGYVAHQNPWSR